MDNKQKQSQSYCRISNLVENNIAKRQAAFVYLKQRCYTGVLQKIQLGKDKLLQLMGSEQHSVIPYN
jgi:hypothetical protein